MVGKCTTTFDCDSLARVTVTLKLLFLVQQRDSAWTMLCTHPAPSTQSEIPNVGFVANIVEENWKIFLSFLVLDSFVNSQEWTLSRNVPEIRLGIVGSLSSGKSALVHRYLTGSYMQVTLGQIFPPFFHTTFSHPGRVTGGRKV